MQNLFLDSIYTGAHNRKAIFIASAHSVSLRKYRLAHNAVLEDTIRAVCGNRFSTMTAVLHNITVLLMFERNCICKIMHLFIGSSDKKNGIICCYVSQFIEKRKKSEGGA